MKRRQRLELLVKEIHWLWKTATAMINQREDLLDDPERVIQSLYLGNAMDNIPSAVFFLSRVCFKVKQVPRHRKTERQLAIGRRPFNLLIETKSHLRFKVGGSLSTELPHPFHSGNQGHASVMELSDAKKLKFPAASFGLLSTVFNNVETLLVLWNDEVH